MGRAEWKLGDPSDIFRLALVGVSCHFAFFTTDGMSAINHSCIRFRPITDLLIYINSHNADPCITYLTRSDHGMALIASIL